MPSLNLSINQNALTVSFNESEYSASDQIQNVGAELHQAIKQAPYKRVILDLKGLEYISSEMIGQFISANNLCKSLGVEMRLWSVPPEIKQVLDIMHLEKVLKIVKKGSDPFDSFVETKSKPQGRAEVANVDELATKAEGGDTSAMVELGEVYQVGAIEEQDNGAAYGWFHKAAKLGDAEGQYRTGFCKAFGIGVESDIDQAMEWYMLAAEQNHAEAQYMVGVVHCYGLVGEVNEAEAEKWYKKSLANGCEKAEEELNRWK